MSKSLDWTEEEVKIAVKARGLGLGWDDITDELVFKGYPKRTMEAVRKKISYKLVQTSNDDNFLTPHINYERTNVENGQEMIKWFKAQINNYNKVPMVVKKNPKNQTIVLVLSDLHIGKKIVLAGEESYNLAIAKQNLNALKQNFFSTYESYIKKEAHIDEIVLAFDGDIIDGELIYMTQHSHIEENVVKQLLRATKDIWRFIKEVSSLSPNVKVRIVGCKGNHGRVGDLASEGSNWDLVLLNSWEFMAGEECANLKNVFFEISEDESVVFDVRGHTCMMRHQMPKDTSGSPASSKFGGWNSQYNFDFAIGGHWHTIKLDEWCGKPIFYNGSLSGYDDLAEKIAKFNEPNQWLFGVSDARVPTFMYRLDCKA